LRRAATRPARQSLDQRADPRPSADTRPSWGPYSGPVGDQPRAGGRRRCPATVRTVTPSALSRQASQRFLQVGDGSSLAGRSLPTGGLDVISMHVSGVTVEEVESVIADAIPPHVPPFAVLSCESTATGIRHVGGAGEPDATGRARCHPRALAGQHQPVGALPTPPAPRGLGLIRLAGGDHLPGGAGARVVGVAQADAPRGGQPVVQVPRRSRISPEPRRRGDHLRLIDATPLRLDPRETARHGPQSPASVADLGRLGLAHSECVGSRFEAIPRGTQLPGSVLPASIRPRGAVDLRRGTVRETKCSPTLILLRTVNSSDVHQCAWMCTVYPTTKALVMRRSGSSCRHWGKGQFHLPRRAMSLRRSVGGYATSLGWPALLPGIR
jgi:hypothetical protein